MYMSNSKDPIFEAYETIEEGFIDRLRARTAGAIGSVKGIKDQIAGKVLSLIHI
jgi:hypothetical protein